MKGSPDPRPPMGAKLEAPDGTVVEVVARWRGGVAFDNETTATTGELRDYKRISR